jgi:hypothetical protein
MGMSVPANQSSEVTLRIRAGTGSHACKECICSRSCCSYAPKEAVPEACLAVRVDSRGPRLAQGVHDEKAVGRDLC